MENLSRVFSKTKKKIKADEEIEFHNSIQDWIFTTIYQLWKSASKNACKSESKQKPCHWCQSYSKLDTLLHKTQRRVFLLLKYQGSSSVGLIKWINTLAVAWSQTPKKDKATKTAEAGNNPEEMSVQ